MDWIHLTEYTATLNVFTLHLVHSACLIQPIRCSSLSVMLCFVTDYLALLQNKLKHLSIESALFTLYFFNKSHFVFYAGRSFARNFPLFSLPIQSEKLPPTDSHIVFLKVFPVGAQNSLLYKRGIQNSRWFKQSPPFENLRFSSWKPKHSRVVIYEDQTLKDTISQQEHCENNYESVILSCSWLSKILFSFCANMLAD